MHHVPSYLAAMAVLATACTPALAQNAVAVAAAAAPPPEVSASPEPSLRGVTPEVPEDDVRPVVADLAVVLEPTVKLYAWSPPAGPPEMACPHGATAVKAVTGRGWEVSCMRGGDRHGPHRAFDRAALREVRATYENGRLHGAHVEIKLRPAMQLSGAAPVDLVAEAQRVLAAGWPVVSPSEPVCPAGTRVVRSGEGSECRLPGDVAHGPRLWRQANLLTWTTLRAGEPGATVSLDDRRSARESIYEQGKLTRVLEHDLNGPVLLEVHRGDETAVLTLAEGNRSLSRLRHGKLHGAQTRWDREWRPTEKKSYRDGVELAGASYSGGTRQTVWRTDGHSRLVDTTGPGGVRRCLESDGITHRCETIVAGRVSYREIYVAGRVRGWVKLNANGARVELGRMSHEGMEIERAEWRDDGKMVSRRLCDEQQCTLEQWDPNGKRTATTSKNSPSSVPPPQPAAPLNAIRDLLGR